MSRLNEYMEAMLSGMYPNIYCSPRFFNSMLDPEWIRDSYEAGIKVSDEDIQEDADEKAYVYTFSKEQKRTYIEFMKRARDKEEK